MSSFEYKKLAKVDGKIVYVCDCSVCGIENIVQRKGSKAYVCADCARVRDSEKSKTRKAKHDDKVRAEAVKEYNAKLKHHLSTSIPNYLQVAVYLDYVMNNMIGN